MSSFMELITESQTVGSCTDLPVFLALHSRQREKPRTAPGPGAHPQKQLLEILSPGMQPAR